MLFGLIKPRKNFIAVFAKRERLSRCTGSKQVLRVQAWGGDAAPVDINKLKLKLKRYE